jgi:hypothetical protein
MHDAQASAAGSPEMAEALQGPHSARRTERRDRLVASTLLVLLIAGWLVHLVGVEQTWRIPTGYPILLTASRHA